MDDYTKVLDTLEMFVAESESTSEERRRLLSRLSDLLENDEEEQRKKKRKLFSLLMCKASFVDTKFLYCFDPNHCLDPEDDSMEAKKARERILNPRSFAALGSTADCIQMHELNLEIVDGNENLLKAVFDENNWVSRHLDGTVFVNPRYIVYSYKKDSSEWRHYDNFWSDPSVDNFFFYTCINMTDPAASYMQRQAFRRDLNDAIHRERKEVREKYHSDYNFLVFDSLDLLTDFVVLWRAKNIRPVLETLHQICLRGLPGLGRKQTICSVPVDRLLDNVHRLSGEHYEFKEGKPFDPEKDLKEKGRQYNKLKDSIDYHHRDNHTIDNMTLRAVSSDYSNLLDLKGRLIKLAEGTGMTLNHCFVLGNSDYIGFYKNATDRNICTYLRKILLLIRENRMSDALLRLETSIGLDLPESDEPAEQQSKSCPNTEKLNAAAKWLLREMIGMFSDRDLFSEAYAPWVSSVLELCNMLVQMNRSCIYDSAAFLLLDSLYLFHAWLKQEIVGKPGQSSSSARMRLAAKTETDKINRCISGWIQLTDMITRSGGTIAHMPGYSPLQYHITSSVVELTQAFFNKVARFLRLCAGEKRDVSCVLVPTECTSINTDALFKGKMTILDQEKDVVDGSMLVYIEVPMEVLSQPLTIATMLAHEAGHHYGHPEISLRKARNTSFARALGRLIGDRLHGPSGGNKQIEKAIENIQVELGGQDKDEKSGEEELPGRINDAYDRYFEQVVANEYDERTQCYCLRTWDELTPICEREATAMLQEFLVAKSTTDDAKEEIRKLLAKTEIPSDQGAAPEQEADVSALGMLIKKGLKELFRESLCDVLMLAILHETCGAEQLANYVRSTIMNEAELARCGTDYSLIIMRIYVVWQVASLVPGKREDLGSHKGGYKMCPPTVRLPSVTDIIKEIKKRGVQDDQPAIRYFLRALEEDLAYLDQRRIDKDMKLIKKDYHSNATLEILIKYLTNCRGNIEVLIRGELQGLEEDRKAQLPKELAGIRKVYRDFLKNEFFSKPFYDLVHEYRTKAIAQIAEDGAHVEEFSFKPPKQTG